MSDKIPAIWGKVALDGGHEPIVVARVDDGVPEHNHCRHHGSMDWLKLTKKEKNEDDESRRCSAQRGRSHSLRICI